MNAFLPNVSSSVEAVLEHVGSHQDDERRVVHLIGPPSAGKSVTLRELEDRLNEVEGRIPVFVSPPAKALDSGPIGLMQIGSRLEREGLISEDEELAYLLDPHHGWSEKVDRVNEWLSAASEQVVLIADEPAQWPAVGHPHFSHGGHDLIDRLIFNGTGCDVVFAGRRPSGVAPTATTQLEPSSDPHALLENDVWGELAGNARRLLELGGEQLAQLSPLQLRLLVALLVLDPERPASAWLSQPEVDELSHSLFELLAASDEWRELAIVWQRLARVRRPFEDDLLAVVGAKGLGDCQETMLEHCLLYERQGSRMLHEALRNVGKEADTSDLGEPEESLRDRLTNYYRERVEVERTAGGEWLADEMEAFHHASLGSDFDFERHRPFFVEQLNALGYHLSKEEHRYPEAVRAYERALHWNPKDDYAHHYLAFNLDIQPTEPERAEEHYKEAVELAPERHWWHASLATFYIASGQIDRAREAWNAAKAEFGAADANLTLGQCNDLYMRVARTFLEFGEIELCESVLRGIPPDLRSEVNGYKTVTQMAEARRMARDFGNFVPGALLKKHWWRNGPFRIEPVGELAEWISGEVTEVNEKGMRLEAAFIEPGADPDEHPPSGPIEISITELRDWAEGLVPTDLEHGDFVEIVIEERNGERVTRLRAHPQREWEDYSLPTLRPDPRRYL